MSPGTRQSPPRAGKRIVGVEVHIYRGGNPYKRIEVSRSPATIGRDPAVDIRLDSGHVSRVHAELRFDDRGLRLIDKDSQNGFSVRGAKVKRVKLTAEDTVSLCDFQLTFRPLVRKVEAFESELSEGWAEFGDEDDDPDTGVHERPAAPMFQDPTLAENSVSAVSPEDMRLDEDLDPDELEEYLVPDVPPLLTTMHEEANALLFTDAHARVGVEVIRTVGGQVFDVDLLEVGQSSWWGATPRGLTSLLVVPTLSHFPIVTHTRHGEYRVQIPDGGYWKMFHRGDRDVDVHRSGPLIGCLAEFKDQIEINYGAFAFFVRCVRMPARVGGGLSWKNIAPDRLLLAALLLSLGVHTSAMAIPVEELPPLSFRLPYSDSFVTVDVAPEPGAREEAAPPTEVTTVPPPEPENLPTNWVPTSPQPDKKPRRRIGKRPKPDARAAEAQPGRRSVSVSDFKISGMIAHLPTAHIDNPGPAVRGGASILREGEAAGPGILSKDPSRMRQTPKGRLAPEAIRNVVNQHAREIERCYNASLARERGLEGRLEVEWIVDRIGTVSNTRLIYDEVGSDALKRCLRTSIKRWVFPPPKGGPARVSFPFIFSDLRR